MRVLLTVLLLGVSLMIGVSTVLADEHEVEEQTVIYACSYAGSLSQVGYAPPSSCGRGEVVRLVAGEDYTACLFAGSISRFDPSGADQNYCGRGEEIGFAAGTDYWACTYAGSVTQFGTAKPTNCGRGMMIGFQQAY